MEADASIKPHVFRLGRLNIAASMVIDSDGRYGIKIIALFDSCQLIDL